MNLTKKYRFPDTLYKEGDYSIVAVNADNTFEYDPSDKTTYLCGSVVNRLHEFEKLGYEPEQLSRIIMLYRQYKQAAHSIYGRCAFNYQDTDSLKKRDDAVDTLYYLCKLAGDVENAQCDDLNNVHPSMIYTKEGFREQYVTNDKFKKLMDERIRDAILRPVNYQKVWVTTSSSIKDDEFMKKLKETAEMIKKGLKDGLEYPKKNPWLDFKHQFTATFKVADFDHPNRNRSVLTCIQKTIDKEKNDMFKIDRVLFNNPATIVFWADGTKTVVKVQNGEPYDPEKGLAMAISKKALGNDRGYYDEFQKQLGRGQKHSTPEQFNSEVCHVGYYNNLWHDYRLELACSDNALSTLIEVANNGKATKAEILDAVNEAIKCLKPDSDNEEVASE